MKKKTEIPLLDKKKARERVDAGQYLARAIIEIVGKPKEHIEETMNSLLLKLSQDVRFGLTMIDTKKANKVDKSDGLFTIFTEVEILARTPSDIIFFGSEYMPSNIEVIEPTSIELQGADFSAMFNEYISRIHATDFEYKKLKAENNILSQSLSIMVKNSILILLNLGPRNLEDISKVVGVDADQTKIFLEGLVKDKKIVFDKAENSYSLNYERSTKKD
jgi:hypothetical protein